MVEYFQIEGVPLRMFRCVAMRASLSVDGCARNWEQAQTGDERRACCRSCPIGAKHSGNEGASCSELKGSLICARCHRPSSRSWLLDGHLCVSCKNREYEWTKQRNGKGARPSRMLPLECRAVSVCEAGRVRRITRRMTQHDAELVVAALRDCSGEVTFFPDTRRAAAQMPQQGLF